MATKTKKTTKTKTAKKTTAAKSAAKKSGGLKNKLKNMNKGKMIAAALVVAIGLASHMANAASAKCMVKIGDKTVLNEVVEIPQKAGEAEGVGSLLLVDDKDTNIQVYVLNYPLQVVAVELDMGVPVRAKRSNRLVDALSKFDSSRVHTYMGGTNVDAVCDKM